MSANKTGFIFYFDNWPMLVQLSPEQRGWLITALCAYADRVWRDQSVTAQEVADLHPQLSDQARTAFFFLGATVLRDTRKWLERKAARELRRSQSPAPRPVRADPLPSPQPSPGCYAPFPFQEEEETADPEQVARRVAQIKANLRDRGGRRGAGEIPPPRRPG